MCSRCQLMHGKRHRCPSRTFSRSLLWYIIPVDLCIDRFTSDRVVVTSALFALVSAARARMIKIQSRWTFCNLRRSGLFSDMATGRRGSDLSEMSQSLAGLRLICSSLSSFFFIFCMFSLKMNSREILVCFSSLNFFTASVLRRFKMIELSEFGDCLRGLFTREMTLLFNAYSGLKACECLSYSEFFIP